MAKKEDLSKSFGGGTRRKKRTSTAKELPISVDEIERVTKTVHTDVDDNAARPIKEEVSRKEKKNVKTSLDFPPELYDELQVFLFTNRKTIKSMREYMLDLICENMHDMSWDDYKDKHGIKK